MGSGRGPGGSDGDGKPFFYRTATGDIHGVGPLHTLHQEEEKSQRQCSASNINQPVPAHSADQYAGHAVESGRPASPT